MPELQPVSTLCELSTTSSCKLLTKVIEDLVHCEVKSNSNEVKNENKLNFSSIRASQLCKTQSQLKQIEKDSDCEKTEVEDVVLKAESETLIIGDNGINKNEDEYIDRAVDFIDKQRKCIDELSDILSSLKIYHLHWSVFSTVVELIGKINSKNKKLKEIIGTIFPKFINSRLKELDFGRSKTFSEATVCQAMFNKLNQATELERLVIPRSCFWRKNIFSGLNDVLPYLKNLKVLHIHFICTPGMIKNLSKSCPLLEELNVHGSDEITDEEIPDLSLCQNLTTLVITGTKITGTACRRLLLDVQSLQWLEHCPFNCHTDTVIFESRQEVLEYINKQFALLKQLTMERMGSTEESQLPELGEDDDVEEVEAEGQPEGENKKKQKSLTVDCDKDHIFNLRFFWLFNPNSFHLPLTQLCPELEHLRLDFNIQDLNQTPEFEIIARLKNLNKLTLNLYDACRLDMLTNVIEITGHSLSHLHLYVHDDSYLVFPVQNVVIQNCPNLKTLTLDGDYKKIRSIDQEEGLVHLGEFLPPGGLPHLEVLELIGLVTDERLMQMLLQAPNLSKLVIDGQLENLTDDGLIATLNMYPLRNLQDVWINVTTSFSLAIVHYLLKCENKLRRIGRLCHFNNATKEEYKVLLDYINLHNFNTTLIWVTDQRF